MKNSGAIRSSELAQWCFCPRQWYLFRTTGKKPEGRAVTRGLIYHKGKAGNIQSIQRMQRALVMTAALGGIACLARLFFS